MFRCQSAEMNTVSPASAHCAEVGFVRPCTENTVLAVVLDAILVVSIFVSVALRLSLSVVVGILMIIVIMIMILMLGTSGLKVRERY